jgi:HPt (histidine-containing phosphotransfer) domain-containing protein
MSPRNDPRPPIDKAEALERIGGDQDFLAELLALYDAEFAEKRAALVSAIAAGEMDAVRALGHGLKGSSANLSLPGLREAAQEMETAGGEKNAAAALEVLERLNEEYRALKAYLG